jgi:hypothetical protein
MTIKKRGERWSVEVYDPRLKSRKRYVGTFGTQREARAAGRTAEGRGSAAARTRRWGDQGHTDGGRLVQTLYGHPSEKLARKRIKEAAAGVGGRRAEVHQLKEANGRRTGA